ncbi:MAG: NADPH:quinone reductase-like Zn-dependent oxidoreductase [Myxococcota bacterium]
MVLEARETATLDPRPGEVRIAVVAAGINFADIMARMGLYPDAPPLPAVVGYEVSGTVEACGSGVSDFAEGDRVVAATRFGGYISHAIVPANQLVALPDNISIDYRNQDFEAEIARLTGGDGVDIALDAVGGASFGKSYRSLRDLGQLYVLTGPGTRTPSFRTGRILEKCSSRPASA